MNERKIRCAIVAALTVAWDHDDWATICIADYVYSLYNLRSARLYQSENAEVIARFTAKVRENRELVDHYFGDTAKADANIKQFYRAILAQVV